MNHNLMYNFLGHIPGYQPPNFGGLIGLMIALFVCTMMNMCSSSCSRKTVSTEEDINTQISHSVTAASKDSTSITIDFNKTEQMMSEIESWWNATWTKRTYSYDSLGNQSVTSEESAVINGGKQSKDSIAKNLNSQTNVITVKTDTIHDTLAVNNTIHTKYTQTIYKTPWYYKLGTAIGILFMLIMLVVFLRRMITKNYTR